MKIRNGFVSNSSSSSFIVAVKPGDTKITIEVDLNDLACRKFTKLDQIEDLIKEEDEDCIYYEILEERLDQIKEALKEGKIIFAGNISSEGDALDQYLYEEGLEKHIKGEVIDGY